MPMTGKTESDVGGCRCTSSADGCCDEIMNIKERINYFERLGISGMKDEPNLYIPNLKMDIVEERRQECIDEKRDLLRMEDGEADNFVSTEFDSDDSFDLADLRKRLEDSIVYDGEDVGICDTGADDNEKSACSNCYEASIGPVDIGLETYVADSSEVYANVGGEENNDKPGSVVDEVSILGGEDVMDGLHKDDADRNCGVSNVPISRKSESSEETGLPQSREIMCDLSLFNDICPELLKCRPLRTVSRYVDGRNLYASHIDDTLIPLFSSEHIKREPLVFRAPGICVEERPYFRVNNSIISEDGILMYLKVMIGNTHWYVRKCITRVMDTTELPVDFNWFSSIVSGLSDREFSAYILSDISTVVYRRSPYVFYESEIVRLGFTGDVLCIYRGDRCIKIIRKNNIKKNGAAGFIVSDNLFMCSCTTERDEWMESMVGCENDV